MYMSKMVDFVRVNTEAVRFVAQWTTYEGESQQETILEIEDWLLWDKKITLEKDKGQT